MTPSRIGKFLTLMEFVTCTETYQAFQKEISPYPSNEESIRAIEELCSNLLDPLIDHFGFESFKLTYGFCSKDLKRCLNKKKPNGEKWGRVDPTRDQHMACETNSKDAYYCSRKGAACDLRFEGISSKKIVEFILQAKLPFDRLYFYGSDRPIHISYGPDHTRYICIFNGDSRIPRKAPVNWLELAG